MSENPSAGEKASQATEAGKQAASDVAATAVGKAQDVAAEAKSQARDLVGEARTHVRGQAGEQQRAAAGNLRSLGDELRAMSRGSADGDQPSGTATHLVGQAADRAHGLADWLDARSPEDILTEARRFAQRRPAAFLVGALAAGVLAGRLARGVAAEHSDDTPAAQPTVSGESAAASGRQTGSDTLASAAPYGESDGYGQHAVRPEPSAATGAFDAPRAAQ